MPASATQLNFLRLSSSALIKYKRLQLRDSLRQKADGQAKTKSD